MIASPTQSSARTISRRMSSLILNSAMVAASVHRPIIGRYASSCGSWSPYSVTGTIPMALSEAIIATYITIHIARSPQFTQ
jgi:hypothetical protein